MILRKPLIYLITKGDLTTDNYSKQFTQTIQIIELAVNAGISHIQIREKNLPARLLFDLTSKIVNFKKNSDAKILVNDRADVALAARADGVHLTSKSISTQIIRQNVPQNFMIGVSTHSIKEVIKSKTEGADFVTFSPIFQTPEKEKYGAPQGIEKLAKVVKTVKDFPVIALGGINEENLDEVFGVGASGIAAIRLLNEAEKLPQIIEKIKEEYEK